MPDRSQQTEPATPHRIEKARREGRFASSRELLSAVQFLAFVVLIDQGGRAWLAHTSRTTRLLLAEAFRSQAGSLTLLRLCQETIWNCLLPLLVLGAALVPLSLAAQLATTRMGFSLNLLAPKLERLNPVTRLRELGRQNVWALIKALVMLPLFGAAVWAIARDNLAGYLSMPLASVASGLGRLAGSLMNLLWKAAAAFLVLGAIDLVRQKRRYAQDLRMSRQELREEVKEQEGNPQIKMRIRRLQRDLLRRQMMKEVKTATAVIVNPTHYAVALRYRTESMAAPRVVAKGKNYLAKRIRLIAEQHDVPVIENPPLAQALYQAVKVGQEIPVHLYRAVAEILAYIYRLMNGKLPG